MSTAGLPEKPLLRVDEVASFFSVKPKTVRSWHAEGRIECVKLPGGGLRVRRECVIQIINSATD